MRPDINLQMGEFVVMPNHFHAIIIIGENEYNHKNQRNDDVRCTDARCTDAMHCVSTTNNIKNRFGPQSKNLASIIRGFKIGVTTHARKINSEVAWQRLFHDHIIRDEQSFKRIQTYINENPAKWIDDVFYNF